MFYDCLQCNECGKIYKLANAPRYCNKCGNMIRAISLLDGKPNSKLVIAKRTLLGWKKRKIKDRLG